MRVSIWITGLAMIACVLLAACGGGSKTTPDPVVINSINLSPSAVAAGSVVALSASISAPNQNVDQVVKNWTVSVGTLSPNQPDFSLVLRATAQGAAVSSLSTTANTIYWVTPSTATTATITLDAGDDNETRTISIGNSPITMSIGDGNDGAKVVTIRTNEINDLYQAALRVNHSSAWTPSEVAPGDFLGDASLTGDDTEVLWLGLTDQQGFAPFAISRVGAAPGADGSGVLARITFLPNSGSSSAHAASQQQFDLSYIVLRDSQNRLIPLD